MTGKVHFKNVYFYGIGIFKIKGQKSEEKLEFRGR